MKEIKIKNNSDREVIIKYRNKNKIINPDEKINIWIDEYQCIDEDTIFIHDTSEDYPDVNEIESVVYDDDNVIIQHGMWGLQEYIVPRHKLIDGMIPAKIKTEQEYDAYCKSYAKKAAGAFMDLMDNE